MLCLSQSLKYSAEKKTVLKPVNNSQFTINSTIAVAVLPTPLLTTRVKFFVSIHVALSMMNEAVVTKVWVFNSSVLLYQDALDNGLLEIFLVKMTFTLSFTICNCLLSMVGWSKITKNLHALIIKSARRRIS